MSKTNPASNAMSAAAVPAVPEVAWRFTALAARTLASVVTAYAMRRAYRELAAFDDRLLADIGLDRATVETLASRSLRETRLSLARLSYHRIDADA